MERHETDLVRLAAEAGEKLYPAHRIDKVTSGALLLARELRWHGGLTRQFNRRTVDKVYLAITRPPACPPGAPSTCRSASGARTGSGWPPTAPRSRSTAERALVGPGGRGVFRDADLPLGDHLFTLGGDGQHTLLAVHPVTGRRHQIRVHLAWIGHPIEGDPLFGGPGGGRTQLHSWRLGFDAEWAGGARIQAEAPPGPDFWAALPAPVPLPGWDATRPG